MTTLRSFSALVALVFLSACPLAPGSSYGKACASDDDCGAGYRCWTDTCVPEAFGAPTLDAGDDDAGQRRDAGDDDGGPTVDAGPVDGGHDDDAGDADAGALDGGVDVDGGADAGPHWCHPDNVVDVDLEASVTYQGDTREGVDALLAETCMLGDTREQVLRVVAPATGTLHFELLSSADLGVVVLDHCDGAEEHQRYCYEHARPDHIERGRIGLDDGEVVYLAVDGFSAGDEARWTMTLDFVTNECGNGHADPGESCDTPDPWCVACNVVEGEKIEGADSNDTPDDATAFTASGPAAISPAGDVDVYSFGVSAAAPAITARVLDTFGGSACFNREVLAPELLILAPDRTTVLARASGGDSSCVVARVLADTSGVHYLLVHRTNNIDVNGATTFPYFLDLSLTTPSCGDGVLTLGEQCDDGNTSPGDGCSETCTFETVSEVEPNDDGSLDTHASPKNRGNDFTTAAAQGPFDDDVVIEAALFPAGDEDGYLLQHSRPTSATVTAKIVHPLGPYAACPPDTFELLLHVLNEQAEIVMTSATPTETACDEVSFVLPPNVPHYLHVHDYGDDSAVERYFLQIRFD